VLTVQVSERYRGPFVCLCYIQGHLSVSTVTESYPLVVIQPCTVDIILEILSYHSTAH